MAEEIEKLDLYNIPYEKMKKEDNYIDVCETSISVNNTELKDNVWDNIKNVYKIANIVDDVKIELPSSEACNIVIKDNVKIEKKISIEDIKIEFNNELLFCDNCDEHYEDYCTKCDMLAHIFNRIPLSITDNRAIQEIPNDVLEIRESSGHMGVFALKVIPESVKIGPFNGLGTSECPLRVKGGKFLVTEDKSKSLNWMQHVNPARNMFQQNLIPFRCEDKLYYKCNREILAGEELLVYFGVEYEDSLHKNIEMDFVPPIEDHVRDVFGCTFCCFGFSSKVYLTKHKNNCPNEMNGKLSVDEIKQCPFCKVYFYEKEYLECHKPYCSERNVRKCVPLTLDKGTLEINKHKSQRLQRYKCKQCKYKTAFKADLRSHINKHYEVKMYKCKVCCRQFKTNGSLKLHAKSIHVHVEGKEDQKCSMRDYMKENTKAGSSKVSRYSQYKTKQCPRCEFQTKYEYYLEKHIKTKHLKELSFECSICGYKTNMKWNLERHIKAKHLKEFNFECEICGYKTNYKQTLEIHIKSVHLKEFSYECEICGYKTNDKQSFKKHIQSIHLKEFSFKCKVCGYKTNKKSNLEIHVKTKHLKEFIYECETCDYKTNRKDHFETHVKSKHFKEFSYDCEHLKSFTHVKEKHLKEFIYECEICDYKTNKKSHLQRHLNTKHLKEFSYKSETCGYKTNDKQSFKTHIKSVHLKEFGFKCNVCDYKTNHKQHLQAHVKAIHLKEFSYGCETCGYKTNDKGNFEMHIKSVHLKEFSYECGTCAYKTNYKKDFEIHVKSVHLKEFCLKCKVCSYQTNSKWALNNHTKAKHLK